MEFDINDLASVQLVCNRCNASVNVQIGGDLNKLRCKKPECKCGKRLATPSEQTKIQAFVELLAELRFNTPHAVNIRLIAAREPVPTAEL